jgi:hypothetical protein
MLSPCLGNDSKTLMLANISPLINHSSVSLVNAFPQESLNTLRFTALDPRP